MQNYGGVTEPQSNRDHDDARRAAQVLGLIDLTSLGDDDDGETVDRLCDQASTPHGPVAAVCVWARFVDRAVARLAGTGIPVAAVANFPQGGTDPSIAVDDARRIVDAGGVEVDVVYPWSALLDGDRTAGPRVVTAVREAIGAEAVLKVIVETGELRSPQAIAEAAGHAVGAGADFLKTSTGKTPVGATHEAVGVLLDVIEQGSGMDGDGRTVGVKVSGGVRRLDDATAYLDLIEVRLGPAAVSSATVRIGASSLLGEVLTHLSP
ncbi:MAG: deoxyribose-phosphate aldolase [Actinomycetota bacterium]